MKTDEKTKGKSIYQCDGCGIKEIAGRLVDWVKEGTYTPFSPGKPEQPNYYCPRCAEERK